MTGVQIFRPESCDCVIYTLNSEYTNELTTKGRKTLKYYNVETNPDNFKFNKAPKEIHCVLHQKTGQAWIQEVMSSNHDIAHQFGLVNLTKEQEAKIANDFRIEKERIRNL